MTVADIIDRVMAYTDEVNPLDADAAGRRARILQLLQEVYDEVWMTREWGFSYATDTVTLNNGEGTLPEDFLELGVQGGVYSPSTRSILTEDFYQSIQEERLIMELRGPATKFMIQNPGVVTNSLDSNEVLTFFYRINPTILTDGGNLDPIPVGYHNTVLMNGTMARSRKSKGDMRDWESKYQLGLGRMVAVERSKKVSKQRLPLQVNNW